MPGEIFRKRAPLTKRERKYCSCLLKVRDKTQTKANPYAVCTSSIYSQQGVRRQKTVDCDTNYEYEKIPLKMLQSLAKEKKIPIHTQVGTRKVLTKKKTLIGRLSKSLQERRTKYKLKKMMTKK